VRTTQRLQEEEAAFAGGGMRANEWRAFYLAVRSDERARGVSCSASRFFTLVRYDEPLALQPPEMTNRSYYAGRDLESSRQAGPIGPCDYIVTTAALQATDKGQNIAQRSVGEPRSRVSDRDRTHRLEIAVTGGAQWRSRVKEPWCNGPLRVLDRN
jgi:hypothetical protein